MTTQTDTSELWADQDWVPPQDRQWLQRQYTMILVLLAISVTLYIAGMFAAYLWTHLPLMATLMGLGVAAFIGMLILLKLSIGYRQVPSDEPPPTTVFHISSALWANGEVVTLTPARSRAKARVDEGRWGKTVRAVYFFPQRPTNGHARRQNLSRARRAPRYLYELRPLVPLTQIYSRGAARATPEDLTVEVLRRQLVPRSHLGYSFPWRKRT